MGLETLSAARPGLILVKGNKPGVPKTQPVKKFNPDRVGNALSSHYPSYCQQS